MPFFTHDGTQFHYRTEGSGLAFIFQHGLGADLSQPFNLVRPPPGFRLLAFDTRDHGQTRPVSPPERLRFNTFAEDLLALLDHLEVQRAIVGGISMGAGVALNFILRFPDRALGLVLSRPAWLDAPNPWNVKMFSLITRLIRGHGARRGQELFKQTSDYQELLKTTPEVAHSLALQFESPGVEETAFRLESIIRDAPNTSRREWESIHVPTLILANRQDPIHPFEYGEILARHIPGAELKEITAKSVSIERHNADVQRCISDFLQGHFVSA